MEPWKACEARSRARRPTGAGTTRTTSGPNQPKSRLTQASTSTALAQDMPAGALQYESGFEPKPRHERPRDRRPRRPIPQGLPLPGLPSRRVRTGRSRGSCGRSRPSRRPGAIPVPARDGERRNRRNRPRAVTVRRRRVQDGPRLLVNRAAHLRRWSDARLAKHAARASCASEAKPFVELNPEDAKRLGIADGDEVVGYGQRHRGSPHGRHQPTSPRGAVFIPSASRGSTPESSITGTDPRVEVRKSERIDRLHRQRS